MGVDPVNLHQATATSEVMSTDRPLVVFTREPCNGIGTGKYGHLRFTVDFLAEGLKSFSSIHRVADNRIVPSIQRADVSDDRRT